MDRKGDGPQPQPQPQQAQQPKEQQVEEMVLRKRVVPVEYDVGATAKRAKRKDVEDNKLKVLRRVLDEGCKKGLWRCEVELMENEEQQLKFAVKDVERREEEDEEMNKLRLLITKYTIYDRAERKCKSIKLFICLEAQRIFKTKKVSKAEYLRPFINTPEHRFLEYMLTIGLKLDSIQSWLDQRKCAVDFWRLKELLDIDFSTTSLSQIKNIFK
ncbi:unnamed protein product [Mucor hiemalis]